MMRKYIGKTGSFAYVSIGKLLLIVGRGNFGEFKRAFRLYDQHDLEVRDSHELIRAEERLEKAEERLEDYRQELKIRCTEVRRLRLRSDDWKERAQAEYKVSSDLLIRIEQLMIQLESSERGRE